MIKERILKNKNTEVKNNPSIKDLFDNDLKLMALNVSKGEDLN